MSTQKEVPSIKDIWTEAPKDPQKDFEQKLNVIKTAVELKTVSKEKLSPILDTNFKNQLEKNKDVKKADIKDLYEKTKTLLMESKMTSVKTLSLDAKPASLSINKVEKSFGWFTSLTSKENIPTLNEDRTQALQDLQDFLSQYVSADTVKVIDIGDAKKEGTTEKYNEKHDFVKNAKTEIEKFTNIPKEQKDKLLSYLNNPSKENIQALQNFMLAQSKWLAGFDRGAFYKSSFDTKFQWKDESKFDAKKSPDGKFGKGTLEWFKSFMTAYDTYFKSTKESTDRGVKVAIANDVKNEKQESATDVTSKDTLDKTQLAWVLDSKEVSALNDTTLKIDGDAVVYRGEKIPFTDLGISKFSKNASASTGGMAMNENQDITMQNTLKPIDADIVLSYLNGDIKSVDGSIWVDGKNSADIRKTLDAKKKEIDVKVTEKLKNSVVYNDTRNTYQYKGKEISRDKVGNEKGKLNLQQFQNEVDKSNTQKDNFDRTVTTQTSLDGKTTRTVKDFEENKGQKIIVNKENADGSSLKTVDAKRGDRSKLVTTETDKEWNTTTTKIKETKNAFKEKGNDRDISLKANRDTRKEAPASATDVANALKNLPWYTVSEDGLWGIKITATGEAKQTQEAFLENFSSALKSAGITNLDMKDYKITWPANIDTAGKRMNMVNRFVFDVGSDTKKEVKTEVKQEPIKQEIATSEVDATTGRKEVKAEVVSAPVVLLKEKSVVQANPAIPNKQEFVQNFVDKWLQIPAQKEAGVNNADISTTTAQAQKTEVKSSIDRGI